MTSPRLRTSTSSWLPSLQAHDPGRRPGDDRLRQREEDTVRVAERIDLVGKVVVEFLGDVARELEMLLLVVADRDVSGTIDENVGRHQVGVGVQPDRSVLAVLAGLFLELRHAVEPAEPGDAVEHPGQVRNVPPPGSD